MNPLEPASGKRDQDSRVVGLLLIAVFKLIKGALLIAVGIGGLKLLHRDVSEVVGQWIDALRIDPNNRYIHRLLVRLWTVDERKLEEISAGSFFYAGLLLTEGFGLLFEKRWAEYFTVIITGSLLPLEVYELVRGVSLAKILLLIVNVAVVWYLIARLRRTQRYGSENR